MSQPSLYDEDILLWSEEQAAMIRQLGRSRRSLPNELDVENVAEEIESVGRSELASVESYLELILFHLIKISLEPQSDAARHRRAEVVGSHGTMKRRYNRLDASADRLAADLAAGAGAGDHWLSDA